MKKDILHDRDDLYDIVDEGQKVYGILGGFWLQADNYRFTEYTVVRKTRSTLRVSDGSREHIVSKKGVRKPRPTEVFGQDILFPTPEDRDEYLEEAIRRTERDEYISRAVGFTSEENKDIIYALMKSTRKNVRRSKMDATI